MSEQAPRWIRVDGSDNGYLEAMLELASNNYQRQIDWFLRHRDAGLRNLAAVLAAEFAVASVYFGGADGASRRALAALMLFLLAIFAIALAATACQSCGRSFKAYVENVLLVTKTVWAMGLGEAVSVAKLPGRGEKAPLVDDTTLYVPRYLRDAQKFVTTEAFVESQLRSRRNTYFLTRITIWMFCVSAVVAGVATGLVILVGG